MTIEFGRFGASKYSERLEPSIRRDGGTQEEKVFSLDVEVNRTSRLLISKGKL